MEIKLRVTLGINTLERIWSALKQNVALRRMDLSNCFVRRDASGSFWEAWFVNPSSDLPMLLQVLRRNRTMELLELPYGALPFEGLHLLIETIR